MKNPLIILTILILTSCATSEPSEKEPTSSDPEIILLSKDSLTTRLDSLLSIGVFNGFAVAIVNEEGIQYSQGFGLADCENKRPYTAETLTNIASISKMFIGIALLSAEEQGLLSLDDPISEYIPFEVVNPKFPSSPITIRQLATHTSSIVDGAAYMEHDYVRIDSIPLDSSLAEEYGLYYKNPPEDRLSLSDFLSSLLAREGKWYTDSVYTDRIPGATYAYSNTGAALCALVIESASGTSFDSFTEKNIFRPLGMHATAWTHEKVDMSAHTKLYCDSLELPKYQILSYPDGGLITNAKDLSMFLHEFIKGHLGKGTLLEATSYAQLFTPQLKKEQVDDNDAFNVGLFTEMHLDYNVVGHSGGDPGVNTMMFYDTEKRTGRIMLLNTDSDKEISSDIYWGIWNALDAFQIVSQSRSTQK